MDKYPSFEQIWTPFTQGWFMLSLVEIGPVLLEKKILDLVNVTESLHQRMLCANIGWKWSIVSGEEDENVKRLRRRTTDKLLLE